MKQEDLNPKAREALAKSCIDVGVGIFKAIMLVIFVLPITLIVKDIFDGEGQSITFEQFWQFLSSPAYFVLGLSLVLSMIIGLYIRGMGLKILHQMEESDET